MSYRKPLVAIGLVVVLMIGSVGPVSAHDWQTEVEQGDMVLGVNSSPEKPIAGMQTEFSASITDTEAEDGQANRTDWGGVTNKEVEVHVNGPGDIHDHVTTHIAEDDSHFHFAYTFPEAGEYTITLVTTIDGQEYAFEFQRQVELLPARAEGETMDDVDQNVEDLQKQVDDLSQQVDTLQQQNDELEAKLEESEDDSGTSMAGIGLTFGAAVAGIAGGFLIGRRADS